VSATDAADLRPAAAGSASAPRIQVILGSTRNGRFGDRVADWFIQHATGRDDLTAELVDLRDWPLPFFDQPTPPMRGDYTDAAQRAWAAKVAEADGFVFVTPEYNHGYPAVLKNALDHLYAEWMHKPAGFVGYGGLGGGIRAVEQLRQVVIELAMVPVREQVVIPSVYRVFGSDAPLDPGLDRSADALLSEVARWARARSRPSRR
jgi:NAD(P)H-dependent FMN reductase